MAAVLDAQALIALVADEPAAQRVEDILVHEDGATSAVNLAEVVQRLLRDGAVEEAIRDALEPLGLRIIPIDHGVAWRAGGLRARDYDRRRNRPSLADCCLVAAAGPGDRIITADRAVAAMARAEGLEVEEL